MNITQKKELLNFSIGTLLLNCLGCIIMLFVFSSEENTFSRTYSINEVDSIANHNKFNDNKTETIIPLKADYNNQIFKFKAEGFHAPSKGANSWFYVGIDVLNNKKEYEYSTEINFWDASGYEGGYAWHENHMDENFKFVRENKGEFYIKITSIDYDVAPYTLNIGINSRAGSTILFWIILLISIALIIGIVNYRDNMAKHKSRIYYD